MNDRPDLARITDADGVHLGQEDLPVQAARRLLGTDAVIGVSCDHVYVRAWSEHQPQFVRIRLDSLGPGSPR